MNATICHRPCAQWLTSAPTFIASSAAHPYYVLAPHATIDFVAPKGPNPPLDPFSVENFKDDESVKFLSDEIVKEKLATAKKLSDVKAEDYDVIFYIGGQGPVLDLASDPVNTKLANDFFRANKITAAVCHGTAALVGVTDADGRSIFLNRKFTGFSNAEEEHVGQVKGIPFLLETEGIKLGGKYEKADELFGEKIVVDGNLYTGQNPASAKALGEVILAALKAQGKA